MDWRMAQRLRSIPPYLFVELRRKVARARAAGVDVINLAVGDPVEPSPPGVVEELCRTAWEPENQHYPTDEERGMLAFRAEVAAWYERRYGVHLDATTEVLALIGSKEGCHHFALARVNPGDVVLMTDPGYPAYRASILLAGGEPYAMPLRSENGFLPDFDDVPPQIRKRARAMFLNYPNNPTGACATASFLAAAVAFAAANDIAVCYDNPYSEIVFDGQQRLSFFSVPGAKDVGIELSSLSKSFNMCGWRIGMTVGNTELIRAMAKVKENTDSGIFNPIQFAAIRALHCEEETIAAMLRIYEARRELVLASLRRVGIEVSPPAGTFYIWVPIPAGMTSLAFTERLLEKAGVLVAAGTAYGACGEGYVRISLTVPDERLREAMRRIERELADGRNGKDSGGAPSG